jgi:hypothetical protein
MKGGTTTKDGYVYFIKPIGLDGPIKIGWSARPEGRLFELASWSPLPLEVVFTMPGSMQLEANIHDCFADCWSHHEWFRPAARLLGLIEDLKAGVTIEAAIDLSDRRGNPRARNAA